MPTNFAEEQLNVAEAAKELCVSPRTVQYRIANGKLKATKVGAGKTSAYLIARSEVDRAKAAS
ncbi:hypothetical protein GCM10022215_08500 [Nocardioides fonticola]|uniref:Helix-turn-helix domain-containing protein n=1 Tax=Nocardioides fonticola TaxID=450363 RepID=A0ABP7XD74_9ACTN